jgi:hypothetical protein
MAMYEPNPDRRVNGLVILDSRHVGENLEVQVALPGGPGEPDSYEWVELPGGAGARYMPVAGDYLVQSQIDGYLYVNPKAVFEAHWRLPVPVIAEDLGPKVSSPSASGVTKTPAANSMPVSTESPANTSGDPEPPKPVSA